MFTASTMTELNDRVGDFLGDTYTKFDVFVAKKILSENVYTLGQYSTDDNKWARLDNINDFWPENMFELVSNMQKNYELKDLWDYKDLAKNCLDDYTSNRNDLDKYIDDVLDSEGFKTDINKLFNDKASAIQVAEFFQGLKWDEKYLNNPSLN